MTTVIDHPAREDTERFGWRWRKPTTRGSSGAMATIMRESLGTSNLVDQLMKCLDSACFNAQYFHGTLASAELRVRALALSWSFCPSSSRTVKTYHGQRCPAERLNGKQYADNWLENLLISGSMNGLRRYQQNPL